MDYIVLPMTYPEHYKPTKKNVKKYFLMNENIIGFMS